MIGLSSPPVDYASLLLTLAQNGGMHTNPTDLTSRGTCNNTGEKVLGLDISFQHTITASNCVLLRNNPFCLS